MKKYSYSFIISISLLCLWIAGCTVSGENPALSTFETKVTASATALPPTQTVTASPTKTPQPTLTFTPSPVPLVLPAVTMSPQEAKVALQELLKTNGNCTGKCIAGIRPDEMTLQEAVNEMARWGMLRIDEDRDGRTFINTLHLDSLYKQVNVNLTLTKRKKIEDLYTISFYMPRHEDGEFLDSDVWLSNRDAWRAFRFDNLLKVYGTPSFVGFSLETRNLEGRSIGYTLEIQYEKLNLEIGVGALAYAKGTNIFLCPSKDPHSLGITINFKRPLTELQQFTPVTWQALTGSDLKTFYRKFTDETNPDACITTTVEQIITLDPSFR